MVGQIGRLGNAEAIIADIKKATGFNGGPTSNLHGQTDYGVSVAVNPVGADGAEVGGAAITTGAAASAGAPTSPFVSTLTT